MPFQIIPSLSRISGSIGSSQPSFRRFHRRGRSLPLSLRTPSPFGVYRRCLTRRISTRLVSPWATYPCHDVSASSPNPTTPQSCVTSLSKSQFRTRSSRYDFTVTLALNSGSTTEECPCGRKENWTINPLAEQTRMGLGRTSFLPCTCAT